MSVERGASWGTPGPLPDGLVTVADDRDLACLVAQARRAGRSPAPVALTGGDLWRTLGSPPPVTGRDEVTRLPVDVIRVDADAGPWWAVAHVIAHRGWWRGPVVAVMNAEHRGTWDVAPRAHPGDGLLEVVEVDERLGLGERFRAWRRLATGTHVPHPGIATRRVREGAWAPERPVHLVIDGTERARVATWRVTVEPDALVVCV